MTVVLSGITSSNRPAPTPSMLHVALWLLPRYDSSAVLSCTTTRPSIDSFAIPKLFLSLCGRSVRVPHRHAVRLRHCLRIFDRVSVVHCCLHRSLVGAKHDWMCRRYRLDIVGSGGFQTHCGVQNIPAPSWQMKAGPTTRSFSATHYHAGRAGSVSSFVETMDPSGTHPRTHPEKKILVGPLCRALTFTPCNFKVAFSGLSSLSLAYADLVRPTARLRSKKDTAGLLIVTNECAASSLPRGSNLQELVR